MVKPLSESQLADIRARAARLQPGDVASVYDVGAFHDALDEVERLRAREARMRTALERIGGIRSLTHNPLGEGHRHDWTSETPHLPGWMCATCHETAVKWAMMAQVEASDALYDVGHADDGADADDTSPDQWWPESGA